MPILVDMPSRGTQISFPDDSTEEEIKQALARDFPRSGEDVAWDLQDYGYKPSLEDFKKYRSHMEKKKVDWGEAAWAGAGEIAKRVGKGILGLAEFESAEQIPGTAIEGVAAGTYSLYGVLAQSDNPASSLFKFKDWISGTGTDIGQYDQFIEARKVWKNIREAEEGGETISGIDPAYVNQDVRNALELVADPSVFIPFAGGPKVAALAARAAGRVGHAAGTGVRAVGRAGAGFGAAPEFLTTLGARTIGAPAEAAGLAGRGAGSLTTLAGVGEVGLGAAGAGVGLPFGTAAATFTGAKIIGGGLDAAGEAMQHLSRSMGTGASRTGAFAALAADESASLGARTLGGIGRRFGADALAPYVGSAAAGVGIGAGVGGTLGYLSQGEEGLFGGLGGGLVLGAAGGLAGRGISHLTGGVRAQRVMGDASRAIALMPEAEGAKAQILVERFAKEGDTEAIATLLNTRGWLGEEIPLKFVRDDEVVMKPDGTPAMVKDADGNMVPLRSTDIPFKGVHIDDANNAIYINVDRAEGGTVLHEALHGALRTTLGKAYAKPMADALMKNLNENQLGAYIWRYVDYKGLKGKAREQAKNDFLADPLKALEEINADYFMDFLQRRENRDLLLTGKRSVDNIILGNLKNAYDSVLHKIGITDASPFTGHKAVDSLVRELIDARRAINKRNVKQGTMATPVDLSTPAKILTFNKEHGMDHAIIRDEKGNPIGVKDEATLRREMFEMGLKIDAALKDIPGAKEDFLSDKALAAMKPILPPEIFAKLMTFRALRDGGKVASIANSPVGGKKGEQTLIFPRGIKESDTLIHSARRSNTPKPKKDGTYSARQMDRGLGLLLKTIDLSMLRNRADDFFSRPGMLDPWGGDKAAAMADVKRYAENLASDAPTPSAEFFGGGRNGAMKRDILNKIWGAVIKAKQSELVMNENALGRNVRKESWGGGDLLIGKPGEGKHTRVTEDIRAERVGKITETGESYRYTEGEVDPVTGKPTGAYAGMQVNFQPDRFTPEKLPGGEAFVHESGYNILQKGRGKFRVYKPDGELLGLRDTMKSAASLAGRNYQKGVARFQPSPEIDPLGMFSKAESAALELKQAKGSGQQMLAMLKKAGVKAEEMQYLGLDEFLKDKKSVTRDEIHDHIVQNQITVEETVLGGEAQTAGWRAEETGSAGTDANPIGTWRVYDETGTQRGSAYDVSDAGAAIRQVAKDKHESPTKHPTQVEPGAVEGSYRELLLRLPDKSGETQVSVDAVFGDFINEASLAEAPMNLNTRNTIHRWISQRRPEGDMVQDLYRFKNDGDNVQFDVLNKFIDWNQSQPAPQRPYTSGHYGEYPNTLAHIRFQDRQSEKYGKVLDIQEVQSDWHQEGRKKGYKTPAQEKAVEAAFREADDYRVSLVDKYKTREIFRLMTDAERSKQRALDARLTEVREALGGPPDAPFKTSWHELAMKRMIKYAADNGYDAIAWTKGETQAARYDLSKQVEYIDVEAVAEVDKLHFVDIRVPGEKDIHLEVENGIVREGDYKGKGLDEIVGKDVADKVFALERGKTKRLAGADLKVGGEGMKGFYDKMLPRMKTWKKLGLKVEEGSFAVPEEMLYGSDPVAAREILGEGSAPTLPAHIVRLSPEVKAKVVEEGMARFQPADSTYLAAVKKGDTATAQRLVDDAAKAAGYTVGPVYHGTSSAFTKFDPQRLGESTGAPSAKEAFFFTDHKGHAEGFAGFSSGTRRMSEGSRGAEKVMNVRLKLENPKVTEGSEYIYNLSEAIEQAKASGHDGVIFENSRDSVDRTHLRIDGELIDVEISADWHLPILDYHTLGKTPKRKKAAQDGLQYIVDDLKDNWRDYYESKKDGLEDVATFEGILNAWKDNPDRVVVKQPDLATTYAVFDPNQIKSADPVTYNDAGKVIPLSERFDVGRDDIRFMPAESLTNGTAWRTADGYNVLQKGKRGKFRAYAPSGKLIGIYDQLKTAQKAAIRLQEKDTAGKARFMPAEEKPISEKSLDETLKDFTAERATVKEEIESSITPKQKEAILYSESLKVEDPDNPLWGGLDGIWDNFLNKAADNRKRVRDAHKNTYFGIYNDYFEAAVKDPRFPTSTEINGVPWSPASFVSKKLEGTGIMQYPVDTSMTVGETIKSIENQYKEAFGFVPEVSRNQ